MWTGDVRSINPRQCLSVGPGPWTQSVTVPQQGKFIAGELTKHLDAWRHVTNDYISLQAIVGVKIPLLGKPPLRCASKAELDERRVDPVIDEAVKVVSTQAVLVLLNICLQELLELKAVQEMQEDDKVFLSRVFTVPKTERGREYGRRFILNLKVSLFHTYQDLDRNALFLPLRDPTLSVRRYQS